MLGLKAHVLRHINQVRTQLYTQFKWLHRTKCRLGSASHHCVSGNSGHSPPHQPQSVSPLTHKFTLSFLSQGGQTEDVSMCPWLGKTHISSLRFHIPGIPSEDHCSPFFFFFLRKATRGRKEGKRFGRLYFPPLSHSSFWLFFLFFFRELACCALIAPYA